jgi:hypothetical protein
MERARNVSDGIPFHNPLWPLSGRCCYRIMSATDAVGARPYSLAAGTLENRLRMRIKSASQTSR